MDTKKKPISYRNRFMKLSLKKNRINTNHGEKTDEHDSNVIVLEESFDCLMYDKNNVHNTQIICSPIVIDDSVDSIDGITNHKVTLSPIYSIPSSKEPSKCGNISFNGSEDELPSSRLKPNRPSDVSSWSPAQNIICATPKYQVTPSTPKDIANESFNECSMKKIEQSQKKLLDDLYGEIWKTMPTLFKTQKLDCDANIIKKLDFSDGNDSDKENIKIKLAQNKLLYLTSSNIKSNVERGISNTERKSKKKLYTEKVPNTPEPLGDINKKFKRQVQTTTKKPKAKTVTELVQIMKSKYPVEGGSNNPGRDVEHISHKMGHISVSNNILSSVKKLTFMGSLADNVPSWRCHVDALMYKENYKTKREELTRRLYKDFNELVFFNNLDEDMPIIWDARLRSSAGLTMNRSVKTSKGIKISSSTIKLSTKILDGPQRLRDTLIHEMCHAATWIIDKELRAGHGPLWKKWATRALHTIPELGEITRCHDMEIHFKYSYKCTKCGYSINRHSKSIDITKKCCGYCRGQFELIVNKKTKEGVVVSTPARRGGVNDFALYVKENYADAKVNAKSHAEVMKVLAEQFSARKRRNMEN